SGFLVPVRGGTDVCGFPTLQCVRGLGWFYLWALDHVEVLDAIVVRVVTRRCVAFWSRPGFPPATPSPSLSSSSLSPLLRWWGGSPPVIGGWWHQRARGGAVVRAWSEEEVANRREGPLMGSFFVKEVVSISWDPRPREPIEGVLRAMSVLELAAHSAFLAQIRQSFVSLPLSALVPEPRSGARREAAAWPGCGVASVVCFRGGSVSPFAGVEAGARLASRARALRVHGSCSLAVASSCGRRWSSLVRTGASGGFRSMFLWFRGSVPWCLSVVAPVGVVPDLVRVQGLGGSAFGPSTRWRSEVAVLVLGARRRGISVSDGLQRRLWRRVVVSSSENECCELLYPSELRVVFCKSSGCAASLHDSCACCRLQLLLCRVRGECGHSTCSCCSGKVGVGLTGSGLPCVEDACEPVQVRCSWSSSAHLSVCASRRLREPTCGVAFTGAGLLSVELVEGVSALLATPCCWGVCCRCCVFGLVCLCSVVRCARDAKLSSLALTGCELWLRSIAWLPCVLVEVSQNYLLLSCWFGWCILEGFSHSGALVVLVEVLPGPACVASAVLLAAVFSLMVRVVWPFGLCILMKLGRILVRFSQDSSWRFLVEVLPKAASCCFGCVSIALLCTGFLVGLLVQALFQ
ncbi:hypothetical protein Taro_052458, partial [Colocasia esculenta]|nr:hypothetical protein [Colocasia esculenta]